VIADRADYEWAAAVVRDRGLGARVRDGRLRAIHFSPVWDTIDFRDLAQWILDDRLPVRFQIQQHKVIWGEMPGV
jgi:7-carboxy-7-deazaguanine synthase